MANMHYCRFRNTRSDLDVCLEAMADRGQISEEECEAARAMMESLLGFMEAEGIVDGYDEDALEELLADIAEEE